MTELMRSRMVPAGLVLAGLTLTAGAGMAQEVHVMASPDRGEFYRFASRYWWLIFPVLSMIWGMIDLSARHRRAREGLHLIKSYIDQGKEPPPELVRLLETKASLYGDCRPRNRTGWPGVFLFAALCGGFLMFAWWPGLDWEPKQVAALHFVALVMAGLGLGCLINVLQSKDGNPRW